MIAIDVPFNRRTLLRLELDAFERSGRPACLLRLARIEFDGEQLTTMTRIFVPLDKLDELMCALAEFKHRTEGDAR